MTRPATVNFIPLADSFAFGLNMLKRKYVKYR